MSSKNGKPLQKFTAVGQVVDDEPLPAKTHANP